MRWMQIERLVRCELNAKQAKPRQDEEEERGEEAKYIWKEMVGPPLTRRFFGI